MGQQQSFSTTSDVGGLPLAADAESPAAWDTGAAANLVCLRRLEHRSRFLWR